MQQHGKEQRGSVADLVPTLQEPLVPLLANIKGG